MFREVYATTYTVPKGAVMSEEELNAVIGKEAAKALADPAVLSVVGERVSKQYTTTDVRVHVDEGAVDGEEIHVEIRVLVDLAHAVPVKLVDQLRMK